jgi:hypothetical protein
MPFDVFIGGEITPAEIGDPTPGSAAAARFYAQRAEAAADAMILSPVAAQALSGERVVKTLVDGRVDYASVDRVGDAGFVVGVTQEAIAAGSSGLVQPVGEMQSDTWSWTPGPIYLGLNGAIVQTPPAGAFVQRIGTAIAADRIMVFLQTPILTP